MNPTIEKQIGKNVRNIREKRGFTQENVSAKMQLKDSDVTRSALAKIEVGQRHIYVDEIIALKEILDVEYDELLKK